MIANLNRRKFFGFGAGAAVAAPVAMKQVAGDALGHGWTGPPPISGVLGGVNSPADERRLLSRALKESLAELARTEKPRPAHEQYREPIVAQRIDGLRSVSQMNKARMMVEERERIERLRQKGWIQRHIDSIKERLGPLGSIL